MKIIKKLCLSLITLIMLLSFNKVHADTLGSITINGTTKDKTYEIYKIFDLTYSGSKVAYTIDSDWVSFFENAGKEYIVDTKTDGLNQISVGNKTKYMNITSTNIAKFTQDALKYAATLDGNDGSIIAASKTETFTNLELGYYLVYPKGATDILVGNASICSITSTMPSSTVNIKATYPTITKEVDDNNAFVGQIVTFTITGQVPDTTGYDTYTYEIKDTMTSGLLLDSENANLIVKFKDDVIETLPVFKDNGFTLTFDMTKYQDYAGDAITITYQAVVTKEAVNSDTTKNSATLTYSNDPKSNETTTTPPVEIPVYSSELKVIKVDANDEEVKLAGATFVLKNTGDLYYQALDSENKVITNVTSTDDVVLVKWVEDESLATHLTTDDTGIITFKGIENGTYYLEETVSPIGYNKLTSPVTIKVGYENEEGTNLGDIAVSHEEIVKNNTGTELPSTGGIGTSIFMITGSLLIMTSLVILVANKRMKKAYK